MGDFFRSILDGIVKLALSVQWYDILDIAIVALLIYYCIKLVRQTRAFNLVKGIVFLGVIYLVVSALNMSATSYLFSHLFGDIVIVMILLFQPEIRQAIEGFGRGDFRRIYLFSGRGAGENDESRATASNIAKAIANMSEKKIGALIVLEGKTPLGEIIKTGSRVDASVSSPVIENIFFPKAPLHDGAMIVRDNRIHSAGCILPLSKADISKELGTRHRAALGMSEDSDARVLVVSEETGAISFARFGQLTRNLTLGELLETLNNYLLPEDAEKQKTFIRRRKSK
ncbi:MAG: diadenylate cyclase CdaA [Oscillospiraceae bacterium]|nr:diadenylate cyclase CdaA [Oscillospiraceae bacterium]